MGRRRGGSGRGGRGRGERGRGTGRVGGQRRCGNCQRTGHYSSTCTREAWKEDLWPPVQSDSEEEEEPEEEAVEEEEEATEEEEDEEQAEEEEGEEDEEEGSEDEERERGLYLINPLLYLKYLCRVESI